MTDRGFMRMAIALARKGEGWCHPNPLVGAVIVKEGRIIGCGYHERYGGLHAERNAFCSLKESAEGADLYVTLEPCCHQGRQPPCTDLIIEQGIRRVVIGSADPNQLVNGRGIQKLKQAGIEVVEGCLKEECDALNRTFFHYITTKTPYVRMKFAMTADGKTAAESGASKWITGPLARARVQEMRHASMGIMVGVGTVLIDDPMLDCRMEEGRDPVRIICDSQLRIPLHSKVIRTSKVQKTIIACARRTAKAALLQEAGAEVLCVPDKEGRVDLVQLMHILGEEKQIDSILLEGGGTLNAGALKSGIVQEVNAFIAPKIFGGKTYPPVGGCGIRTPDDAFLMKLIGTETLGEDLLIRYRIEQGSGFAFTDPIRENNEK